MIFSYKINDAFFARDFYAHWLHIRVYSAHAFYLILLQGEGGLWHEGTEELNKSEFFKILRILRIFQNPTVLQNPTSEYKHFVRVQFSHLLVSNRIFRESLAVPPQIYRKFKPWFNEPLMLSKQKNLEIIFHLIINSLVKAISLY